MSIQKIFAQNGKEIIIEGNQRIFLNDPAKVWYVVQGQLALFALKKNQDRISHHTFIFTAQPNALIFGLDQRESDDCLLFAKGYLDTHLAEMALSDLIRQLSSPLLKNELIISIDNWINQLTHGIITKIPPKKAKNLAKPHSLAFIKDETAIVKNKILWVKISQGKAVYSDYSEIILSKTDCYLPLTGFAWLHFIQETQIILQDTEYCLNELDLFEYLTHFHFKILDIIALNYQQEEIENDNAIQLHQEVNNRLMNDAIYELASTLNSEIKQENIPSANTQEELLYQTCKLICQQLNFELTIPSGKAANLEAIAKESRLQFRQVMLKDEWWHHDNGPLLGFWEESENPVALLPINKAKYELVDLTKDKTYWVDDRVNKKLKHTAYTVYRPFSITRINFYQLLKFGLDHTWRHDRFTIFFTGILTGFLGIVFPIATGFIFDRIIPQAEYFQLLQLGVVLGISSLSLFLFQLVKDLAVNRIETQMNYSIEASVWSRLLSLPASFFKKFTSGDLSQRAFSISTIRKTISGSVIINVLAAFFSLFNGILLFHYSFLLALIAIGLVITAILFTVSLSYACLISQRKMTELEGSISGLLLELINGVTKFKVAGAEHRGFFLWAREFKKRQDEKIKSHIMKNYFSVFYSIFPLISSILLFYFVTTINQIQITIGNFLAFNAAFIILLNAMLTLANTFIWILSIIPLYERVQPILTALPEISEHQTDPGLLEGNIEVNHLHFSYQKDSPLILNDVSFHIPPGKLVAIAGPSGSGKSTLLRLLLGLEHPVSGGIYYDGQDLLSLDIRYVRRQTGVVLQNSGILAGDIYSNIIGAATHLTLDDAWEAAENAGLAEDINEMPMGMHTVLNEGGTTLSQGQRQRLLIARSLVNKPRIIFFDEATSALDNKTQAIVSRSLEKIHATRIVIAHRLSTIRHADRILVLDRGKIVQQGSYDELIKMDGLFQELARRQL